jgi:dTDP-4-dehydrorhamnose reductase
MKILILGHQGYLGEYLYENLHHTFQVDVLTPIPLLNDRKIYNTGISYDYIINCIGKPNLEYCEKNVKETLYSNGTIVSDIIKFYPNSKVINFSSYYVYDDFGLCDENSKTTIDYQYCMQNLLGEKLNPNGINFRVGKLFGNPNSKQGKLTDFVIDNNDITLDDVKFNPTSVQQVLKVIRYELKNNDLKGIYNLSNSGYTSHYEYGLHIKQLLGHKSQITHIKKMKRDFKNYGKFLMSTQKIESKIELTDWKEDLKTFINKC